MFNSFFLSACLLSLCVFALASRDRARVARHRARPAADHQKRKVDHTSKQEYQRQTPDLQIRKNLTTLTQEETTSIRLAFQAMKADGTYEAIASYHGYPALCEVNGAKKGCCVHGNPLFTPWHRPYVALMNNLLRSHGSIVPLPYWDWVTPIPSLPPLFSDKTFYNPRTNKTEPNPFLSGNVVGLNVSTSRDPQPSLFNTNYFYEKVLLALEQTNFCQFQIQIEMIHNTIHSRVGGKQRYSMSSVDYAGFDPMFFFHHCNVDRLWAFWQALQAFRGLPSNDTSCAPSGSMNEPLVPFSTDLNTDEQTKQFSRAVDTFEYQRNFEYEYDRFTVNGRTVPQIDEEINKRKESDRTLAEIPVQSIGRSSNVDVNVCDPNEPQAKICDKKVDEVNIFGGNTEMPFEYDRPYLTDITKGLKSLGIKQRDLGDIKLNLVYKALDGTILDVVKLTTDLLVLPGTILKDTLDGLLKFNCSGRHNGMCGDKRKRKKD